MPPKKRKNETENDPAHKKGRKKLENSNGSHAAPIESDITEDGLYADFVRDFFLLRRCAALGLSYS